MQLEARSAMGRVGTVHGMKEADIVDTTGDVRKQLADVHAALAVLLKLVRRLHQFARAPLRLNPATGHRIILR